MLIMLNVSMLLSLTLAVCTDKSYTLVSQLKGWKSAWDYCARLTNSQLVAIRNQHEQDALVSYLESVSGQQLC